MTNFAAQFIRLALVVLLLAWPAGASAGTYDVSVPTTSWPGWSSPWIGTSYYGVGERYVDTRVGTFVLGSYRSWRLAVPNPDVEMVGGRLDLIRYTPNDAFAVQVRQGTDAGAVKTLLLSTDNGNYGVQLLAGDWVEFGLWAQKSATTVDNGGNRATMTSLVVRLDDPIAPEVGLVAAPSPETWIGPGCATVTWDESDRGSGLASSQLRNDTTGATVAGWTVAGGASLAPGAPAARRSICIPWSGQANGVNSFTASAVDWSGRTRSVGFAIRFDREAPRISEPADLVSLEPVPEVVFTATDAESGIAQVRAVFDGVTGVVVTAGDGYIATPAGPLAPGMHDVAITVTDRSGNSRTLSRTLRVGDSRPPTLSVRAPGASGGPTPILEVTASDAGSGVDAESWRIAVNGRAVPAQGSAARLTVGLGPLTRGEHVIMVSAADALGNRGSVEVVYNVVNEDPRGAALAGGRSGLFLAGLPTEAVVWGSRVTAVVTAAEAGAPLTGYRIVADRGRSRLASEVADVTGVAELRFIASAPGTVVFRAVASRLDEVTGAIRVAPRITIRTATTAPRAGARVAVTGRMQPSITHSRVALEARVGGSWYPLRRSVTVGPKGKFRTVVTSAVPGDVAIRVRFAGGRGWSAGASNVRVLHVR